VAIAEAASSATWTAPYDCVYIMVSGNVSPGSGGYATVNGTTITTADMDGITEGRNVYLYYNVKKGSVINIGVYGTEHHMHLHAKEK